jgi:nicotinate-nucleotide adenylyltransferase
MMNISGLKHIGLFFGSFNPVHIGHLIIANALAQEADFSKIWFVVSPQNPFKPAKGLLHEFDRFDLVQAAIADNPKLAVTDVEFHLPRPGYTIDTLKFLSEKYPDKRFSIILGADNLESLPRWKSPKEIVDNYGIYVYPRPDVRSAQLDGHRNIHKVEAPMIDISATYIRNCIRQGKSIRYLVPDVVEEMIRRKGFYLSLGQ